MAAMKLKEDLRASSHQSTTLCREGEREAGGREGEREGREELACDGLIGIQRRVVDGDRYETTGVVHDDVPTVRPSVLLPSGSDCLNPTALVRTENKAVDPFGTFTHPHRHSSS
jgi:hypothetical protein